MSGKPRHQAHQNTYAFKHNPASKKTAKILALPNVGLCKECFDMIEWKKKYRKYKPLTVAARCSSCQEKVVKHAYHTICQPCAQAKNCCAKCVKQKDIHIGEKQKVIDLEKQRQKLDHELSFLPERKRRAFIRAWDQNNVTGVIITDDEIRLQVEEVIRKRRTKGLKDGEDDPDDLGDLTDDEDDIDLDGLGLGDDDEDGEDGQDDEEEEEEEKSGDEKREKSVRIMSTGVKTAVVRNKKEQRQLKERAKEKAEREKIENPEDDFDSEEEDEDILMAEEEIRKSIKPKKVASSSAAASSSSAIPQQSQ